MLLKKMLLGWVTIGQKNVTFRLFSNPFDWAIILIKDGKAYVDSQSSEDMAIKKEHQPKVVSLVHIEKDL